MRKAAITMAHGAGGQQTARLIKDIFAKHFAGSLLTADDAAVLPAAPAGTKLAMTTDGFIVSPWQFPGGNIGKLSICGTVNDLACMGALPKYLTCAFQIEEGFLLENLEKIVESMASTAREADIELVAGDTKVAGHGQVDGIFITTTGMGWLLPKSRLSGSFARPGDAVIVSGDIGRHGAAILLARNEFRIEAEIESDCAPLGKIAQKLVESQTEHELHVLRDATRGGVGTVLHEIAEQSQVGLEIETSALPIAPAIKGLCGLLGLDALYLACEGRMVIIAEEAFVPKVLSLLKEYAPSQEAALIGHITDQHPGQVTMATELGTQILLSPPSGELLPRIC